MVEDSSAPDIPDSQPGLLRSMWSAISRTFAFTFRYPPSEVIQIVESSTTTTAADTSADAEPLICLESTEPTSTTTPASPLPASTVHHELNDTVQATPAPNPQQHDRTAMGTKDIYPGNLTKVPASLRKYWHQRYHLFSRYDSGIRMDQEGWYSVTPEAIAIHIAQRCRAKVVVDAFCGVGGNTIQLAHTCDKVIAIDIDPQRLSCAKHNARIYGVDHKIRFILGDFMELAPSLKADVVFLSPPWGGPAYLKESQFDLETMIPLNGVRIFLLARQITPNIAYFLPRNSRPDQIGNLTPDATVEVELNRIYGKLKSITAYFGELAKSQ
ncbi:RNA methylase protein [Dimargaris xerosporica]|nr:RNA methylase protein [Dimargaris xerosporica]